MVLHWWKILCYTKSCDYATLKAEKVQYLGSRLRRELALQGNKLQAVDIEQTDVATLYCYKSFFG